MKTGYCSRYADWAICNTHHIMYLPTASYDLPHRARLIKWSLVIDDIYRTTRDHDSGLIMTLYIQYNHHVQVSRRETYYAQYIIIIILSIRLDLGRNASRRNRYFNAITCNLCITVLINTILSNLSSQRFSSSSSSPRQSIPFT